MLPGDILKKYQTLTGVEYPTLRQFIDKAQEVADRITRSQKNKQKDGNSNSSSDSSQKSDASQNSTIPTTISTVNQSSNPKRKKACMFCKTLGHFSSRCPTYVTVKDRAAAVKDIHGSEPCYECLIRHKPGVTCSQCTNRDCKSQEMHGVLACPLILAQLQQQASSISNS